MLVKQQRHTQEMLQQAQPVPSTAQSAQQQTDQTVQQLAEQMEQFLQKLAQQLEQKPFWPEYEVVGELIRQRDAGYRGYGGDLQDSPEARIDILLGRRRLDGSTVRYREFT